MRSVLAGSLLAALLLVACGGTTSTGSNSGTGGNAGAGAVGGSAGSAAASGSGGAGGSTAGAGGTAGTSGTSGSGGSGGTFECGEGAPCATPGATCTPPDECCPCSYRCEGGSFRIAACPGCLPPICPPTAPKDGEACDPCLRALAEPCSYDECPGAGVLAAQCVGKQWSVSQSTCPARPPCGADPGSAACPAGSLCVFPGGLGDAPHCEPNPCAPGAPVSCDCAGSLCTYGFCSSADSARVDCACPYC